MIGQKFGKLIVLAREPSDKWRRSLWRCACDCGCEKIVTGAYLKNSPDLSCGCTRYVKVSAAARKYNTLADYLKNTRKKRGTDCRLWQGRLTHQGYGTVGNYTPKTMGKRSGLVHRRVFVLVHGFVPPVVMHTCDTPQCINPAHLKAGTKSDNTKDAVAKGRLYAQKEAARVRFRGRAYTLRALAAHTGIPLPTLYWRRSHGKPLVPRGSSL